MRSMTFPFRRAKPARLPVHQPCSRVPGPGCLRASASRHRRPRPPAPAWMRRARAGTMEDPGKERLTESLARPSRMGDADGGETGDCLAVPGRIARDADDATFRQASAFLKPRSYVRIVSGAPVDLLASNKHRDGLESHTTNAQAGVS